jgi:predicted transcriptional regulator
MIAFLRLLEKGKCTKRTQDIYALPSIQMVSWILDRNGLIEIGKNANHETLYGITEKGKRLMALINEAEKLGLV